MEKVLDVMRRTLELAVTCQEGIDHILMRLQEGGFEDTIFLFEDIVAACCQMEKSVQLVLSHLPHDGLEKLTEELHETLEKVVFGYEKKDRNDTAITIESQLIPIYRAWKEELDRWFHPYVLS